MIRPWKWASLLILNLALISCSGSLKVDVDQVGPAKILEEVHWINPGLTRAQQEAQIGFGIAGRIRKIFVNEGDEVRSGQILAELENDDVKTRRDSAERDFKRDQKLFKTGYVTKIAFESSKKSYELAQAAFEKTLIRAPFNGVVMRINGTDGERSSLEGGSWLIGVIDQLPRVVEVKILEADFGKVSKGQAARIEIPALSEAALKGDVERKIPILENGLGTVLIHLRPSRRVIPINAKARGAIITQTADGKLTVKSDFIFKERDQSPFVWKIVRKGVDDVLLKVKVKLGAQGAVRTEIFSDGELHVQDEVAQPIGGREKAARNGLKVVRTGNPLPK